MKIKNKKYQIIAILLIISTVFICLCFGSTDTNNVQEENKQTFVDDSLTEGEVVLVPEGPEKKETPNYNKPIEPPKMQLIKKSIRVDFMEGFPPNVELYAMVTTEGEKGKIEIRNANTNALIRVVNRP